MSVYSDFITQLPKADLPMEGVVGHLMASDDGQVVFFELPQGAAVPLHSHGAQWGIVVEGQIELTIGDETKKYGPGDYYHIADGEQHAATVLKPSKIIDVFSEAGRYQAK
jgi:quercetin dioxygenase-like cupin family protein